MVKGTSNQSGTMGGGHLGSISWILDLIVAFGGLRRQIWEQFWVKVLWFKKAGTGVPI